MSTLYVVATPIGNLEEMSPRAIRILKDVSLIAAEDTRHSGRLLRHFGIETPMISYHAFNERARIDRILDALGQGDVALISDAGTPGISDPGQVIVAAAHRAGHVVSPISGPSSLAAAVSASGLVEGPFMFLGFLPREAAARRKLLSATTSNRLPFVIFESPNRLVSTLHELNTVLGDPEATAARELSKLHEEVRRGTLSELAAHFGANDVLGEVVIVVAASGAAPGLDDPEAIIEKLLKLGMKPSEAAREGAAISGLPRSDLYEIAIRLNKR